MTSRTGPLSLALLFLVAGSVASGCRAQANWPLWERYAQQFLDPQGRIIDHAASDITTSEGQSYALFFALVADDRSRFERLLSWTESNLAGGDLSARLPAWKWGKAEDGQWKVLDANSASDSDLWIAYSLLEAGRLWHEPRYIKLGDALASRVAREEVAAVPGIGITLLPGREGFHPDATTWILNPSYLPLPVLARLADVYPAGPWRAVMSSLPLMLTRGSDNGFAMDWISTGDGAHPVMTPAAYSPGNKGATPVGSYDAIRVYLWLGISDPETPEREASLQAVSGMAGLLKSRSSPPETIDRDGRVLASAAPVGFSAALAPFLKAMKMASLAQSQSDRVASAKNASGLYGADPRYYDQNLILFATGWTEERYRFDATGHLSLKWK